MTKHHGHITRIAFFSCSKQADWAHRCLISQSGDLRHREVDYLVGTRIHTQAIWCLSLNSQWSCYGMFQRANQSILLVIIPPCGCHVRGNCFCKHSVCTPTVGESKQNAPLWSVAFYWKSSLAYSTIVI